MLTCINTIFILFVCVAIAAFKAELGILASSPVAVVAENKSSANYQEEFHYLVTVGGKAFFYDNTTYRSWTNASSLCQYANMELASFETKQEADEVISAAQNIRSTFYWTSGTATTQAPSGFYWNTTGSRISNSLMSRWHGGNEYYFCIVLWVWNSGFAFENTWCDSTAVRGVLCQLSN